MTSINAKLQRCLYGVWPSVSLAQEKYNALKEAWGDVTIDNLYNILHSREEEERAFALYALGEYDFPNAQSLLLSYTQSENRHERWASLIALGYHHEESIIEPLQHLLLEGLDEYPIDVDVELQVYAVRAIYPAPQWREQLHPTIVLAWDAVCQREREYSTFLVYRFSLLKFLTQWHGQALIPTMQKTFQKAYQIHAALPLFARNIISSYDELLQYLYHLSFRLGNVGDFTNLKQLEEPTAWWRYLLAFSLMGTLRTSKDVFPYYPHGILSEPARSASCRMMDHYLGWSQEEQETYLALLRQDPMTPPYYDIPIVLQGSIVTEVPEGEPPF